MSEYKNADASAVIMEKYIRIFFIIMWDNIINPIYLKPDFFIYLITLMYSLMSLLFVFIKLITLLLFFYY